MARKKQNPGGSEIVWIAALAGAAYLAYEYFLAPNASAATVAAAANPQGTGTPTSAGTPTAQTSTATGTTPAASGGVVTPALGTPVSMAANLALQIAAQYPYIMPTDAMIGQAPAGYTLAADQTASETGTSSGQLYLRNDVAAALVALLNALNAAAQVPGTVTLATLYNFPFQNLAQLQQIMKQGGLSGLGLMGLYPLYNAMGWN